MQVDVTPNVDIGGSIGNGLDQIGKPNMLF